MGKANYPLPITKFIVSERKTHVLTPHSNDNPYRDRYRLGETSQYHRNSAAD